MKTINSCIFKFRKFFKVFKTKFKWESCRTIFCPSLTSVSSKVCFIKRKFQKFSEAAVCRYSTKIFLFKTWFFSLKKTEWNKLDLEIQNSESISIFKKNLAKFVRSFPDRVFNGHDPHGIKVFNSCDRLSHLCEHKFEHSEQPFLNAFCKCGSEKTESSSSYLLQCPSTQQNAFATWKLWN